MENMEHILSVISTAIVISSVLLVFFVGIEEENTR